MKDMLTRVAWSLDGPCKVNPQSHSTANGSTSESPIVQQKPPLREPDDCVYLIVRYLFITLNIIYLLSNISLGISIYALIHLTQVDPTKFKVPPDERNKILKVKNSAGSIICISIPIAVVTAVQIVTAFLILQVKTKNWLIFYSFLTLCTFVLSVAAISLQFNPILLPHLIIDIPSILTCLLMVLKVKFYNDRPDGSNQEGN